MKKMLYELRYYLAATLLVILLVPNNPKTPVEKKEEPTNSSLTIHEKRADHSKEFRKSQQYISTDFHLKKNETVVQKKTRNILPGPVAY